MKKYLINPLRGIVNIGFLILLCLMTTLAIYITAPFVFITPHKKYRHKATECMQRIPIYWIDGIKFLFTITLKSKFDIQGPENLDPKKPYLLISNHRSWLDILVLAYAFHRKAPSLRFFMKKELLWTLPFAGLAAWLLGYPFMGRHTRSQIRKNPALKNKDIATTQKACRNFALYPATIMNYIEGTRFTEEKRLKKNSPYTNLLAPKAGGIAIVLHEMGQTLEGLIDATIAYQPSTVSFWQFCCGNFTRVCCHYDVLPIAPYLIGDYINNREFRVTFQNWLNAVWKKKDSQLTKLFGSHE